MKKTDNNHKLSGIIEPAASCYGKENEYGGVPFTTLDSIDLGDTLPDVNEPPPRFHGSLFPPEDIFRID